MAGWYQARQKKKAGVARLFPLPVWRRESKQPYFAASAFGAASDLLLLPFDFLAFFSPLDLLAFAFFSAFGASAFGAGVAGVAGVAFGASAFGASFAGGVWAAAPKVVTAKTAAIRVDISLLICGSFFPRGTGYLAGNHIRTSPITHRCRYG